MKYCQKCGKEIMDEAIICPNCGCAVENNSPIPKTKSTKFCQKCGKEIMEEAVICPGCGCAVGNISQRPRASKPKEVSYDEIVQSAKITNIISGVLLAVAVVVTNLFVNMLFGVIFGIILWVAAGIVALIPNTRLQNALKRNGLTKEQKKETSKKLRGKFFSGLNISFALAAFCFVMLGFAILMGILLGIF